MTDIPHHTFLCYSGYIERFIVEEGTLGIATGAFDNKFNKFVIKNRN